ncbi:MAG TPA: glycosyltransferase family 2 protein [Candidatus Dojkabacteria bacterium]|nr:glycosyltransferase family 2 protein [Candidatus Dojkabacteria bacterium]
MENNATVYALMAVKNRWEYTEKCIKDLLNQTYKGIRIIVVDDGSTDRTVAELSLKYPEVVRVQGNGNLWWTGGMNLGLRHIMDMNPSDSDFVLFLNNDTHFSNNYVQTLVNASIKYSHIPIGSVNTRGASSHVISVLHQITNGKVNPIIPGDFRNEDVLFENDTLNGRGTLVPVKIIREVGFLSRLFPHYHADYDYFFRIKKLGYKLGVATSAYTHSQDDDRGLADLIKAKKEVSVRDFIKLFFSRKSYFNLYSRSLLVLMYTPMPSKIIMLAKMFTYPIYFFIKKVRKLI